MICCKWLEMRGGEKKKASALLTTSFKVPLGPIVPSPLLTSVLGVIVLVPAAAPPPPAAPRGAASLARGLLLQLICSTSCLHTDNRISRLVIYFLGTRLEPPSRHLHSSLPPSLPPATPHLSISRPQQKCCLPARLMGVAPV